MPTKKLFMETTAIDPQKTAGEITTLLVASGARQISLDYDTQGKISGLRFAIQAAPQLVLPFALPVRVEPVFRILNGRRKYSYDRTSYAQKDRAQAERVAWRQLLRWIQAQLALVETGMVQVQEVFLPYVQQQDGQTLFQAFMDSRLKALPAPEEK